MTIIIITIIIIIIIIIIIYTNDINAEIARLDKDECWSKPK